MAIFRNEIYRDTEGKTYIHRSSAKSITTDERFPVLDSLDDNETHALTESYLAEQFELVAYDNLCYMPEAQCVGYVLNQFGSGLKEDPLLSSRCYKDVHVLHTDDSQAYVEVHKHGVKIVDVDGNSEWIITL